MPNESSGPGGCLVSILLILVIGAAFGFVEWSTVGSFARFIVYILIAGVIMFIGSFIFGHLFNKD